MIIPKFFDTEEYLQIPIMKQFLSDNDIKATLKKEDQILKIEQYASENPQNEKEVRKWLLKIIKEGTKEICYRKVFGIDDKHRDAEFINSKIKEKYPNCPMKNILDYENTGKPTLIEYSITKNSKDEVTKISFTYSSYLLHGNLNELGEKIVFPVFIELLLDNGFIISKAKAKTTLFEFDEENEYLASEYRINTMDYAIKFADEILELLELQTNTDKNAVITNIRKTLFKIYNQYSFIPKNVEEKVDGQNKLISSFIDQLFKNLDLDIKNKASAINDAKILVEKYISINGENEDIFKKDRDAYLIKVTSDDEQALSKIDASSVRSMPLQCTEVFFDSKKAVIDSKMCRKLNLVFKRKGVVSFPKANLLTVQLGTHNNYGYVKLLNYAEECDIQNVLQAIFSNFG